MPPSRNKGMDMLSPELQEVARDLFSPKGALFVALSAVVVYGFVKFDNAYYGPSEPTKKKPSNCVEIFPPK
jgi:hypothetical protein